MHARMAIITGNKMNNRHMAKPSPKKYVGLVQSHGSAAALATVDIVKDIIMHVKTIIDNFFSLIILFRLSSKFFRPINPYTLYRF
jgi:hypothetical protein